MCVLQKIIKIDALNLLAPNYYLLLSNGFVSQSNPWYCSFSFITFFHLLIKLPNWRNMIFIRNIKSSLKSISCRFTDSLILMTFQSYIMPQGVSELFSLYIYILFYCYFLSCFFCTQSYLQFICIQFNSQTVLFDSLIGPYPVPPPGSDGNV